MKLNQLKAGVFLEYIQVFLKCILSIICTPVMLRLLGKGEYGIYNIALSLINYLGILGGVFSSAYIRHYSKYKNARENEKIYSLNGMFFAVYLCLGMITFLIAQYIGSNLNIFYKGSLTTQEIKTAEILVKVLSFNILFSFLFNIFYVYIIANEQFVFQKTLNLISAILNPGLSILLLLKGYHSIGLVLITTTFTLIIGIINVIYCIYHIKMKISFNQFDKKLLREIWMHSFYVFITTLVIEINYNLDKILLGKIQGAKAVSVYSIGSVFYGYFRIFGQSITSAFIPRITGLALQKNTNKLLQMIIKIARVQLIILMFIFLGFVFLGKYFIQLWIGNGYDNSFFVGILLMGSSIIILVQDVIITVLRANNKHKVYSIVLFLVAVFNIILTIPLCKVYGELGSAFATAVTILLGNGCIMNWYYHKKLGLDMKEFWKGMFSLIKGCVFPIIFLVIWLHMSRINSLVQFLIGGLCYVGIYFFSMWLFGLNQYEKQLIVSPIVKIYVKIYKKLKKI